MKKKMIIGMITMIGLVGVASYSYSSTIKNNEAYERGAHLLSESESSSSRTLSVSRATRSSTHFLKGIYEEQVKQTEILERVEKYLSKD